MLPKIMLVLAMLSAGGGGGLVLERVQKLICRMMINRQNMDVL